MADLSLELFLEKTSFIRGESIRFVATLTNKGRQPVEILSPERLSRALSLKISDSQGGELEGDALSMTEEEGGMPPHVTTPPMITLGPGQNAKETGDVLTWVGPLDPGEYRIKGSYSSGRLAWAESSEVAIRIGPANPVAAVVSMPSRVIGAAPRLVAWIHQDGVSFELFLEKLNPKLPKLSLGNRGLAKIALPEPVRVSSVNANPPPAYHLAWIEDGRTLKVLRLPADAAPEPVIDIPLPTGGLEIVGMPYSDSRGGMFIVLAASDGVRATLINLPAGGKPTATPINPRPALSAVRNVFWSAEEHLFLLWTGEDGKEVHGATTSLAAPANPLEGRRLFTAPQPVASLRTLQVYDSRRGASDLMCEVLCHNLVLDLFQPLRVNLVNAAIVSKERYEADGLGDLRVLQAEIDGDGKTAYLMEDLKGRVYYAPPGDLSATKRVVVEEAQPYANKPELPLTVGMYPHLVSANRLSSTPGFYLRFIRKGVGFEFRKMPG